MTSSSPMIVDPETLSNIAAVLKRHSRFAILAHPRPDPDALGSVLGLSMALRAIGKTVQPISQGPYPAGLRYLPHIGETLIWEDASSWPHQWLPEVVIVLDIGSRNRVGTFLNQIERLYPQSDEGEELGPPISRPIVVNIDHHVSNEWFGDVAWVDAQACATAEMLTLLLRYAQVPIGDDVANLLYAAILTDTGSFHYSNTTPRALRVTADLVEAGADPSEIARAHFRNKSLAQLHLEAAVLERANTAADGRLVWSHITLADMKRLGVGRSEVQDLVNLLTPLGSARIAVFFLEIDTADGAISTKISFRGEGYHNLSDVAGTYGGGGHPRASGATLPGPPEQHIDRLVGELTQLVRADTDQRF